MSTDASSQDSPIRTFMRAAFLLPAAGVVGGAVRVAGGSDALMLAVVVPLFIIAFLGWRLVEAIQLARDASRSSELAGFREREERLSKRLESIREQQRAELVALQARQRLEQQKLLEQRASSDQLAAMMERHRREHEALLTQRTA